MHTALRCILIILFFLVSQYSFATDYKFIGNGSWSDLSNWEAGLKPPYRLEAGNTITIYGTTVNGQSCGEFCSTDLGQNAGTITIALGGSLTLNSATQFTNEGVINVQGTLINQTALQAAGTGTINISGTFLNHIFLGNQGHLIINDGGVLKNEVVEGITHRSPFGRGVISNNFINPGKFTLNEGGTINNTASGVIVLGYLINNGGAINNHSTLKGNPIITGNLINAGTIDPGNSPGTYTINGDYTATSSAIHAFEIDGITTGTYDILTATGTVHLNGAMNITLKTGISISGSTEIPIIQGTINGKFSSSSLPAGTMLDYKVNSVVLKSVTALPVQFVGLEAKKEMNGGTKLSWKVADEKGVIRYEVEKSTNHNNFFKVGNIQAALKSEYYFIDPIHEPISFYRIKSIDVDGKYGYSQTAFSKSNNTSIVFKALFTPSGNELIVHHSTAIKESKIYIHTLEGQLLKVALVQNGTQQSTIAFPFTQAGIYVISFEMEKGIWETTKVHKR